MKQIKLNEEQIKQLKGCFARYEKAEMLKRDAEEEYYRAHRAFWSKSAQIVSGLKKFAGEKTLLFNNDDNCFEVNC